MGKTRPAVVMTEEGIGKLPLQIVIPITEWDPQYTHHPWIVHLKPTKTNGLTRASGADAFQVKSVSEKRLVEFIGTLENSEVEDIAAAIAICVGYV